MEPPIRIKLYGLVTVTKRGYITQLVFAGILVVGLLVMWFTLRQQVDPNFSPTNALIRQYLDYIPWIVLAVAVLYVIEATVVLRRFAREEARRRAEEPPAPPKP